MPALVAALFLSAALGSRVQAGRRHERARDELHNIFTSDAEVRRICLALSGSARSMTTSGSATPYSEAGLQAVRAAHIDDALLLLRPILGDSQASALATDVAEFVETGVPPASLAAAAKSVENGIEKRLERTENGRRILSALKQTGIDTGDLLDVLRRGPDAIDASGLVVRMALRLAQGTHERVDHFASGLPWGLGGLVGWLTEMLLGELLAVGIVVAVKQIELKSPFVRSAEIARRACVLIEQDATRPVMATRMLRQLVVRLSKLTPRSSSIAEYCIEHPRKCARLARRWGVRRIHGADAKAEAKIATWRDFADASFFAVDVPTKYTATDEASLRARLRENGADFDQSLEVCAGSSSCAFEEINYALSVIIFDRINGRAPEVPPGRAPENCVECCEPEAEQPIESKVVCSPLSPGAATDVALVVDRSGSTLRRVASGRGYEQIADAAATVASELKKHAASLTVWAFPKDRGCTAPPGANLQVETFRESLASKPLRSYTPMRATLEEILEQQKQRSRPLSLVVVTDGEFNCKAGKHGRRRPWDTDYPGVADVVDRLGQQGVTIHGVLLESERTTRSVRRRARAALAGSGSIDSAASAEAVAQRIIQAGEAARCNVALGDTRGVKRVEIGADDKATRPSEEWTQTRERIQLHGELCKHFLAGERVRACV
jgi:hypothetical protein